MFNLQSVKSVYEFRRPDISNVKVIEIHNAFYSTRVSKGRAHTYDEWKCRSIFNL